MSEGLAHLDPSPSPFNLRVCACGLFLGVDRFLTGWLKAPTVNNDPGDLEVESSSLLRLGPGNRQSSATFS